MNAGWAFLDGPEILAYSEMNLHRSAFEPATTTFRKMGRLGHFGNPEYPCVERMGGILAPGRHCELYVIQPLYSHQAPLVNAPELDRAGENQTVSASA